MNYTNTYGYGRDFDSEGSAYDESLTYHPNTPLFTEQELSGFDLVQQHLAQNGVPINGQADVDMGIAWECEPSVKATGYGGYRDMVAPQFYQEEEPSVYDMSMEYHKSSVDFYRYSECDLVGSCQTSPFVDPSRLPFEPSFLQPSLPVSPVTPSGSPSQCSGGCHNPAIAAPPALLLVPSENSGHYHYNAYQVPMPADAYMSQLAPQHALPPFQPQRQSPGPVPSLDASPAISEAPASLDSSCDDDDDDEDEDEDVLPNHGNTELRGMGLYDDAPDLLYSVPSPSRGCSPVTPHDQLRPTLGKGLVLERSFGLPEKMMLKDEASGEIVEGKLEVEDDVLEPWNSPALYNH